MLGSVAAWCVWRQTWARPSSLDCACGYMHHGTLTSRQPSCTSALRHPSGARASAHGVGLGEYEAWHAEQVARLESGGDVNDMRFVLFQELSYTVGFGNQVALTKKSDTALGGDVQRPTCTHPPHQVEGLISALIYAVATRRILVVNSRQHTEAKSVSSQTWW